MTGLIFIRGDLYCKKCHEQADAMSFVGLVDILSNEIGSVIGFRCTHCGHEWRIL